MIQSGQRPLIPNHRPLIILAIALTALLTGSASAQDIPLQIIHPDGFSRIIAAQTSTLRSPGRPAYDPRSLWDGRTWSAWACDDPKNAWIEVQFPSPRYVVQLQILAGDASSTTAWRASRRPKTLRVVHDKGQFTIAVKDSLALQTLAFPQAISTSRIRLEVIETVGYGPVAISELALFEPQNIFDLKPELRTDINTHISTLRDPLRREQALRHLEAIGAPAIPAILGALKDPNPTTREGAALLLGRTGTHEGIAAVMSAARLTLNKKDADQDPKERAFMAASLAYLSEQHAVRGAVLARNMYRKGAWRDAMPIAIVKALSKSGHPEVTPLLVEAMRSDTLAIAEAAIPAFAHLGQPGLAGLAELSRDKTPEVRRRAAQALGAFERPRARAVAVRLMADKERAVRAQTVHSLGDSALPEWRAMLLGAARDEHPLIRRAAAAALGHYPEPDAAQRLSELCRDHDPRVRLTAVEALEAHGDSSMTLLVSLVTLDNDDFPGVPNAARQSLRRLAAHNGPALVALLQQEILDNTHAAGDRQPPVAVRRLGLQGAARHA